MDANLLRTPSAEHTTESDDQISTSSDSIQKMKRTRSIETWISDRFVWETLAISASVNLVVAILIILMRFESQPTWKYVSLNSLISWLSTFSKACLLFAVSETLGQLKWVRFASKSRPIQDLRTFDAASRGHYGSA
ncbi:hypothetical protein PENSUB_8376 [Penicillium subrubescens]|jgi:hypothetical protein|uniref:Uncharacterized protein n=1 Tax=Penicillium subrubescens TaxID=1316194 RepID=A0A1Q5TH49_9EURO|nr:hypothetical protein PENSUB_8376 [Penicillium subrubescens]